MVKNDEDEKRIQDEEHEAPKPVVTKVKKEAPKGLGVECEEDTKAPKSKKQAPIAPPEPETVVEKPKKK